VLLRKVLTTTKEHRKSKVSLRNELQKEQQFWMEP
jgi:hypothetical protein